MRQNSLTKNFFILFYGYYIKNNISSQDHKRLYQFNSIHIGHKDVPRSIMQRPHMHVDRHTLGDGITSPKFLCFCSVSLCCDFFVSLNRYPATGNMTVRSVNRPDFELVGGYPVPQGVPIHMHMWSLHNTARYIFMSNMY